MAERRGHQREGKSGEEARARRVEASRQEVARGGGPERREREQRGRQGKEKTGCFAISEISRDLNVKQG